MHCSVIITEIQLDINNEIVTNLLKIQEAFNFDFQPKQILLSKKQDIISNVKIMGSVLKRGDWIK